VAAVVVEVAAVAEDAAGEDAEAARIRSAAGGRKVWVVPLLPDATALR
jgi:hypothetical protein